MYDELIAKLRDHNACIGIKTLDEAADAIEELSKPRWIPVTERLPNPGSVVLAYSSEFFSMIAYYNTENEWSVPDAFITHWMPLPEPPKGE